MDNIYITDSRDISNVGTVIVKNIFDNEYILDITYNNKKYTLAPIHKDYILLYNNSEFIIIDTYTNSHYIPIIHNPLYYITIDCLFYDKNTIVTLECGIYDKFVYYALNDYQCINRIEYNIGSDIYFSKDYGINTNPDGTFKSIYACCQRSWDDDNEKDTAYDVYEFTFNNNIWARYDIAIYTKAVVNNNCYAIVTKDNDTYTIKYTLHNTQLFTISLSSSPHDLYINKEYCIVRKSDKVSYIIIHVPTQNRVEYSFTDDSTVVLSKHYILIFIHDNTDKYVYIQYDTIDNIWKMGSCTRCTLKFTYDDITIIKNDHDYTYKQGNKERTYSLDNTTKCKLLKANGCLYSDTYFELLLSYEVLPKDLCNLVNDYIYNNIITLP